ncbi:hypothetical protein [Actinacidiphila glaucinigra]|uniref:hypothetical protein n=1 Tax=Actinacidiphila glaucinigra TaxID=235986 RepID=UPI0035DC7032
MDGRTLRCEYTPRGRVGGIQKKENSVSSEELIKHAMQIFGEAATVLRKLVAQIATCGFGAA